ncbi:MAG: M67 family metallopeptidase [Kiritimatiellia bacterium]
MQLEMTDAVRDELVAAARAAAPLEACGLLAGKGGRIVRFYPLTNADASAEHFSMLPAEQFAAAKRMREAGLKMLAIWHSHPATPPRMSEEDLRLAFMPDMVYLILSLASDPPALGGYTVCGGVPERIEVTVLMNKE